MLKQKTRDDLGLAITMLDSDRLRQWAEKIDTHGSDISHWSSRQFVSEQLRAVAGRIEATVREVNTLRQLAVIIPMEPDSEAVSETPQPATELARAYGATWAIDNIYTIARREIVRSSSGKPPRPEMWAHVERLCETVGAAERTVGILREDSAPVAPLPDAERETALRALVEQAHETFDPGGTLDYEIDEWARSHVAALDKLARLLASPETKEDEQP